MAFTCGFHPEAIAEYADAAAYYLQNASAEIAEDFVTAVESAVAGFTAAPDRWRIVEAPEVRRCVLRRFPFVIYYRAEPRGERVTIYAVMHCSREPGYWQQRLD